MAVHSPRILVVQGESTDRELIHKVLALEFAGAKGANVVSVAGGAECLSYDLASFDVVILDSHLADDMSGLTLMGRIHAVADIPVLFVTSETAATAAVAALEQGASDYIVKLGDYLFSLPILVHKSLRQQKLKCENIQVRRELQATLDELQIKNSQLRESLTRLRQMAETDPLTGLANRRRFATTLERHFMEAVRYHYDLTCCMCDLDGFKQLNDVFGHQVGDDLLVNVARAIGESLRSSDVAGRFGGDEFVILLPHTSLDQARTVAERIRAEVVQYSTTLRGATVLDGADSPPPTVTMSVGAAALKADNPANAEALLSMADRALYAAKHGGKNRFVAFGTMPESERATA